MRWVLMLLFAAACGESSAAMSRAAPPVLRARPHMRAAIAGCRGDAGSSEVALAAVEPDAPIAIVEEDHMHGGGPPSPTLAIWADGQVLFAGTRDGKAQLLATEMSPSTAAAIASGAYRTLDGVPRATNVFDTFYVSGATRLRITVRDGDRWRSAFVYGDDPARVLAVARGTAAPPQPHHPTGDLGVDLGDLSAERLWPPLGFAKAYQQLVEAVPHAGRPFTPYDYDVLFVTPERGIAPRRPALGWPADPPRPPADLDPAACHYNESAELDPSGGCRFRLAPSDNRAVERLDKAMRSGGGNLRAVTANGIELAVRFDETFRGERAIAALTTCADVLSRRDGTPPP